MRLPLVNGLKRVHEQAFTVQLTIRRSLAGFDDRVQAFKIR